MAVNLLEMIKQGLPGNFSDMAGKLVGESPGATQTALSAALPAILGSIAQKGATTDGAQSVLSLLDNPAVNTGAPGNLSTLLSDGQQSGSLMSSGAGLLSSLLGDKFGALAGSLASVAGLKNSQSASNLLGLLAPIVLGFIKKFVGDNGLGAGGLASLLAGQGQFLQGTLDKRLTSALGFQSPSAMLSSLGGKADAAMGAAGAAIGSAGAAIGSAGAAIGSAGAAVGSAGAAAASTAQRAETYASGAAADTVASTPGWKRWLPWVIAAIVVLFLLSRLSTCTETAEKAPAPPATSTAPTTTPSPGAAAPATTPSPSAAAPATTPSPSAAAPATTTPSSGAATSATTATAPAASGAMSAAAGTGGLPAKVYFEVGKATLSEDAKKTIAGAADAAKKDSAKVELTGYTDKSGDAAQNEELAKNRAVAVKEALVAGGLPEASIGMKPPALVTGSSDDNEARRVEITKAP